MGLRRYPYRRELGVLAALVLLFGVARGRSVHWPEEMRATQLRDSAVMAVEKGGAYVVGWNTRGEVQVNDLARGEFAWKQAGEEFALHPVSERVVIRQSDGSIRCYDLETGKLLQEISPRDAGFVFREEGSELPIQFALSAGMLPLGSGRFEGAALLCGKFAVARLVTDAVVVAERDTGVELLRVYSFESGESLVASPAGVLSGNEELRTTVLIKEGIRTVAGHWDSGLLGDVFGDPGTAPPGLEVETGPWRIVESAGKSGREVPIREWEYWIQGTPSGRITGRGNQVRIGLREETDEPGSSSERTAWSGLQLRLVRRDAEGSFEVKTDGQVARTSRWKLRFAEDGKSFRGREESAEETKLALEGRYVGDILEPETSQAEGDNGLTGP